MAAYSNEKERSGAAAAAAHARNSEFEMDDVYTPTNMRTPSLYSYNDSTLYEPDHAYGRSPSPYGHHPYESSHFDQSSPFNRSPTPSSAYTYTPNHAFASTSRLALDRKFVKQPVTVTRAEKFAGDFTTFSTTYPDNAYTVEITGDHDDIDHLPKWRRALYRWSPLTTLLSVGGYWAYFALRITFTVYAQRKFHQTFVLAWFFIVAEMIVAFPAIFHQLWQLTAVRGRKRKQLRLRGEIAPTVNVLVTCCKEEVDVVLDTVRAACMVDYPRDRFRVTVCDDGADPEIKAGIEAMKPTFPNLYYHARVKVKGVPHHFKAGNLIAATEYVAGLEGGPGEYLAALDADMIPESDWLRAIMAHLCVDRKLALSCPPQLFYNVPDNDPLVQSLDGFVHTMETVKDASGVAWCTGSGYAIRVAALESIGGWPTGSLAEDVCTSSMLLGRGWKTAYIHEPLQWGTVPDDLASHLKQRTRWTLGTLQTAKKLNFFLGGKLIGNMTFFQRLSGFVFAVDAFFKIFFVISIMTFPVVLISGKTMVAYASTAQLLLQVRFCFGALVLQRINEFVMALPAGYRQTMREATSMLWMAPYHAITVLKSFVLPTWLGGKPVAFTSSGSQASLLNERNPALRAGVFKRLKVILWDCSAWMHLLYIMFVVAAVALSTTRAFLLENTWDDRLIYLLTHTAWPPILWLVTIVSFWTPLGYALSPPSMPDREDLLDRNPKTGVAHPKPEWKRQRWNGFSWYYELQYSLLSAFTCFIFVGTFFIKPTVQAVLTPSVPTPKEPVTLCGQYQGVATASGAYNVETNAWGQDSSGSQCVYYDPNRAQSDNSTSFTATWNWFDNPSDVHSFPNVQLITDNLPSMLSEMESLQVSTQWTMGTGNTTAATTSQADLDAKTVSANVAFDCFLDLDSSRASDPTAAAFEFMVWLAMYGTEPPIGYGATGATASTPEVSLAGQDFQLFMGQNKQGQTVHTWLATTPAASFTGDISLLLQYIVKQGYIPADAYLGSVQFGSETAHSFGNVTFDVSNVMIDLQTKSATTTS